MNHFYKIIINDFLKQNNFELELHNSDFINNSIELSSDYITWKDSIPNDIIFGIKGKIIFNNKSIFIEKIDFSFNYIDLNLMNNTLFLDHFLFKYELCYLNKKENTIKSISLNKSEYFFLQKIFDLIIENKDIYLKEEEIQKRNEIQRLEELEKQIQKRNEIQRLEKLTKYQSEVISQLDKDGNGEVDLIEGESFSKLLTNNQNKIIEIDKDYIQKFVKISMYLKTKKSNTQKIFDSIKETKNEDELKELVNLLKNQVHTYELLVFHSISMITSLVESNLITFYEIYECFDQLGVFNSTWENEVSNKLSDIGDGIKDLMYSIYQMENNIVNSVDNLTYTTQDSFKDLNFSVNNQLSSIDSSIKFNNLLTGIQTYQMYKINKNTKRIN